MERYASPLAPMFDSVFPDLCCRTDITVKAGPLLVIKI